MLFWAFLFVCIIYGGLNIFAGIIQLCRREISLWSCIGMIAGGLIVAISPFINSIPTGYMFFMLLAGLILIHAAAINNGIKMHGRINPRHHIVRLGISIIAAVLYMVK